MAEELTGRIVGEWNPPVQGSITSNRLGAAVDDYQANMWGLGEAITGSEWMRDQRLANEAEAQRQHRNASRLGAVDSLSDVNGVGDALNWAGGIAAGSLPYLAETAAWAGADVLTGGALTPAWAARAAAMAPKAIGGAALRSGADFATRRAALEGSKGLARGLMGAGVATYPSSVADVLSNQRDEGGETNLGMALAGGVPYAAMNLLGPEALIAGRSLARNTVRGLDDLTGIRGGLARTGASVGTAFAKEGASETGQELVNQSFGRMAVNPDQTLFNEDANQRYLESFVGGGVLGGAFGSVGGWRRSKGYLAPGQTVDDGAVDLIPGANTSDQSSSRALTVQGQRGLSRVFDTATPIDQDTNRYTFADQLQISGPAAPVGDSQSQTIPGVLNVTPGGTVAPMNMLSGQQYDMFGGPDTFGVAAPAPEVQAPTASPDTQTPDMFQQNPSSMTRTMFNPATEPSSNAFQGNTRGAVAGVIRSLISQQLGADVDHTLATTLSLDLSKTVGDLTGMTGVLDSRQQAVEKSMAQLDKKVTGDSNMLTPEEYAAKRQVLENKLLTIEAARTLVDKYQKAQTNAYAEEGIAKAKPGVTQAPNPNSTTEADMRESNMAREVAAVDALGDERRAADTQTARTEILRNVLAQPTRNNPVDRFQKALKAAGFTDTSINATEQAEIDRITARKADVRDATVIPPGLAAKNGQLLARSELRGTDANNGKAATAATTTAQAAPAAAQNTQTAQVPTTGTAAQPNTAASTGSTDAVGATERPAGQQTNVKRADKKVAMESSIDSLMEAVDTETDPVMYDGAVDALYRRFMETQSDAEVDRINSWVAEQGKAFAKDWTTAEQRYDATERGASKARTKSVVSAETANILNGMWTRFRSATGKASKMSQQSVNQTVKAIKAKLPGSATVEVFANPEAAGLKPPAGVVPKGVTLPDGRILVFSDHAESAADVEETVFHELFHRGMRTADSVTQYVTTLLNVAKNDPFVQKLANDWKKTADGQDKLEQLKERGPMTGDNLALYEALSIDEALADMAERIARGDLSDPRSAIKKVGAFLTKLADAMGLKNLAQKLRRMSMTETEKFVMDTIGKSGGEANVGVKSSRVADNASAESRFNPDEIAANTQTDYKSRKKLVDMNIDDFLRLAEKGKTDFKLEATRGLLERGGKFKSLPILIFDRNGQVEGHEGRHRAMALKEAGYKTMPVMLHSANIRWSEQADPAAFDYVENWPTALKAQSGAEDSSFSIPFPVTREQAGLSYGETADTTPLMFRSAKEIAADERSGKTPQAFIKSVSNKPFGHMLRNIASTWRAHPGLLGWLTLDQIKDRFANFQHVGKAVDAWLKMGSRANELMRLPATLHKQWAQVLRNDKVSGKTLNSLFVETTMEGIWVNGGDPVTDPRNKHIDFTDEKNVAMAKKLHAQYTGMSKQAREVYDNVTKTLDDQFRMKQEAILSRVVDTFADDLKSFISRDELVELATSGKVARGEAMEAMFPGLNTRDKIELQKFAQAVESTYVPRNQLPGPYFPLQRNGEYVVSYKSESLKGLEAKLDEARKALDSLLDADIPTNEDKAKELAAEITAARKEVSNAKAALLDAKGKPDQYVVEFYDNMAAANDARDALNKSRGGTGATMTRRTEFVHGVDSIPAGFLNKLSSQLKLELPEGSRADVTSAVRHMIIQSLPEKSAFKAELKRMNVAGAKPEEALQSFASASHRNAWTISRLENIGDLTSAMNEARASEDMDEKAVGAELTKRWAKSMEYRPDNALIDAASNLSYLHHLGFSVGYYMQNMMQPWLTSLPIMAGKHGMGATSKALADATVEVVGAVKRTIKEGKTQGNWDMPLDLGMFKGAERQLLEMLTNEGRIDITIRADMGAGGSTSQSGMGHLLQRAASMSSWPAHTTEAVNRVATALAAFRLAQAKGESVEASIAYADKVVTQTHFDYSVENTARFMNPANLGGLGKLAFQFKRYQQSMVFLWGKTILDAARGDKDSARALMYLTGVNFAVAGASGLPLAAPIGLMASLLSGIGDDDQDRDFGEYFWAGVRGTLGDTAADLLRRGAPAAVGLDISKRVGSGDILSPVFRMPKMDSGEGFMGGVALQMFGAAGGTMSSMIDAATVAGDNPALAVQKMLPAGLKGVAEALDRSSRGLVDRRGNSLIQADEFGGWDFFIRAFNLGQSTKVSNMYDLRSAILEAQTSRANVRSRLMREYNRARVNGDSEAMADARAEIDAFNARNPREVRISGANLAAGYKQESNRMKSLQGGIKIDKRNKDIAAYYGLEK